MYNTHLHVHVHMHVHVDAHVVAQYHCSRSLVCIWLIVEGVCVNTELGRINTTFNVIRSLKESAHVVTSDSGLYSVARSKYSWCTCMTL